MFSKRFIYDNYKSDCYFSTNEKAYFIHYAKKEGQNLE